MRTLRLMRILLLAAMLAGVGACGGGDGTEIDLLPVSGSGGDVIDGDDVPATGDNLPPSAVIVPSQAVGTQLALTFNGSASVDVDGAITDHVWRFGDGEVGSGQVVSHRYGEPGIYVVSLTVTDDDGATNTAQVTVSVGTALATNLAPGAAFTATPLTGAAPLAVSFDATLSADADGFVTDYLWSFGDGSSGSGQLASHTYTEPGVYDVRLTVVDNSDARSLAIQTIVVSDDTTDGGTGFDVGVGTGEGTGTDDSVNGGGAGLLGGAIGDDFAGGSGGGTGTGETLGDTPAISTMSAVGGDARTVHRIRLEAGQAVELRYPLERIASSDLDLFLFDVTDPQRPVYAGSSVGQADQERVVAPASRDYAVVVEAFGSGTDYQLAVTGMRDIPPRPALTDEFQSGELLVRQAGNAALPADLAPQERNGDGLTRVQVPTVRQDADPYWDGQEFLPQYLTVRRYKQLALDPQVPNAALVPSGTTDR